MLLIKSTPFEVTSEGDKQIGEPIVLPADLMPSFLLDVVGVVPEEGLKLAKANYEHDPDGTTQFALVATDRNIWVDPQEFRMGIRTGYVVTEQADEHDHLGGGLFG